MSDLASPPPNGRNSISDRLLDLVFDVGDRLQFVRLRLRRRRRRLPPPSFLPSSTADLRMFRFLLAGEQSSASDLRKRIGRARMLSNLVHLVQEAAQIRRGRLHVHGRSRLL